jgi:hypothetical protein
MNKYKFHITKIKFRGRDNIYKCYLCGKFLKTGDNFYSIVNNWQSPYWTCSSKKCRDFCILQNI